MGNAATLDPVYSDGSTGLSLEAVTSARLAGRRRPTGSFGRYTLFGGMQLNDTPSILVGRIGGPLVQASVANMGEGVVMNRIAHLRELRDGWLGDRSIAPLPEILDWLQENAALLTAVRNRVSITPVGDGSVALEWSRGPVEYSAQIKSDGRIYFVSDDTDNDDLVEAEAILDADALQTFISTGRVA